MAEYDSTRAAGEIGLWGHARVLACDLNRTSARPVADSTCEGSLGRGVEGRGMVSDAREGRGGRIEGGRAAEEGRGAHGLARGGEDVTRLSLHLGKVN